MKYKHSVLGGTFDHFHAGHEFFIESAFKSSDMVEIGLVEKLIEEKKYPDSIEDYKTRERMLKRWLGEKGYEDRALITPINDIYGDTLTKKEIQAIFVTEHGFQNAREINIKRNDIGLSKLEIKKVNFLNGTDGKIISSTRIRAGEIDRRGNPYIGIFSSTLILPHELRSEVSKTPSGKLLQEGDDVLVFIKDTRFVISVGDIISENLIKLGRQADISIIDGKTRRGKLDKNFPTVVTDTLDNESGTINSNTVSKLISKISSGEKMVMKILGEEDLLALPATLLAPLGTVVLYGMPEKGAVAVIVTEEKKKEVENVLRRFNRKVE